MLFVQGVTRTAHNVSLTLLANKCITVCDLCPWTLLTPPHRQPPAVGHRADGIVWGRVCLFYTVVLSLKPSPSTAWIHRYLILLYLLLDLLHSIHVYCKSDRVPPPKIPGHAVLRSSLIICPMTIIYVQCTPESLLWTPKKTKSHASFPMTHSKLAK